jgi:hypothetical protein
MSHTATRIAGASAFAFMLAGCGSSSGSIHYQSPPTQARPPGLQSDGPLDVGCQLHGTPGYTSYQGVITIYNPGINGQSISVIAINWGSNGVLLSQHSYSGNWIAGPHESFKEYAQAPASATSCDVAGWNP